MNDQLIDDIDAIAGAVSTLDWLTPTIDIYKTLSSGPSTVFTLDRHSGRSLGNIRRMLRRNGVEVWDVIYTADTVDFRTPEKQAAWADYLLQREGVPILRGAPAKLKQRQFRPAYPKLKKVIPVGGTIFDDLLAPLLGEFNAILRDFRLQEINL